MACKVAHSRGTELRRDNGEVRTGGYKRWIDYAGVNNEVIVRLRHGGA